MTPEEMVGKVVVVIKNNTFSLAIVTGVNVVDGTHTVRSVLGREEEVIENNRDRYY